MLLLRVTDTQNGRKKDFFESLWIAVRLVHYNTIHAAHMAHITALHEKTNVRNTHAHSTCAYEIHVWLHSAYESS